MSPVSNEDAEINDYYRYQVAAPITFYDWHIREHGFSPLSPPASPTAIARVSEYSPVSDIEDPEGAEYVPGPNNFDNIVNNPMPVALQLGLAHDHAMAIFGPTTTLSDSDNNDDDEEEEIVVIAAPVTPRGIRYNRRSGALYLVTPMCCFGEAQSTAIVLIPAPLSGPLAMVACLVLIAALGAAIYDYLSSAVPTACTIAHDDHAGIISASDCGITMPAMKTCSASMAISFCLTKIVANGAPSQCPPPRGI
jgi:hypothetical protein